MEQARSRNGLEKLGQSLEKVVYPFSQYFSIIAMVAAMIMMFLVVIDVFLRRVFNSPIFGAYEIEKDLLSVVVFCAVGYVMSTKGHVMVDTLTRLYPKTIRTIVASITYSLCLIILAVISWQNFVYGLETLALGERSVLLRIPVAPFIFVVAFGTAVFFFVTLVQFIYAMAGVDEEHGAPPVGFW